VRQRTLRATIDWSYDLLEPHEQQLFAQLAVFVGDFPLEAAEQVCCADTDLQDHFLDTFQSLVEKHLLQHVSVPDADRVRMLETIHEYAAERLVAGGNAEHLRRRHADYFLSIAEAAAPHINGAQSDFWVQRLVADVPNFRAALEWSRVAPGVAEVAVRLAAILWTFSSNRGAYDEGSRWVDGMADLQSSPSVARAIVLLGLGHTVRTQGDYAQALAYFRESLTLARCFGDEAAIGLALLLLGDTAAMQGDYQQAILQLTEGLEGFRAVGHLAGVAHCLLELGEAYLDHGVEEAAVEYLEQSVALSEQLGTAGVQLKALNSLARIAIKRGDHQRAADLLHQGLALVQEVDSVRRWADFMTVLALLAEARGRGAQAACLLGATDSLFRSQSTTPAPNKRAELERVREAVHRRLGGAAFAASWHEGQAMTLEQALAFALEESRS
jgi:non-specific serine/threonine protein kinase